MPGQTERRRAPRTRTSRPVYVQPADAGDPHFEEVRNMTDVSRIGFYFTTNCGGNYRQCMKLYVIPAFGYFNFEYLGEVVRIEKLTTGDYGIGVRLLRIGKPAVKTSTPKIPAFGSFSSIPGGSSQP